MSPQWIKMDLNFQNIEVIDYLNSGSLVLPIDFPIVSFEIHCMQCS